MSSLDGLNYSPPLVRRYFFRHELGVAEPAHGN